MPANMMKAAVASIRVVTGRRSEMVRAGPMPGRTPIAVPSVAPTNAQRRLIGCAATPKPCPRAASASMLAEGRKEPRQLDAEEIREEEPGQGPDDEPEDEVDHKAPRAEGAGDQG